MTKCHWNRLQEYSVQSVDILWIGAAWQTRRFPRWLSNAIEISYMTFYYDISITMCFINEDLKVIREKNN